MKISKRLADLIGIYGITQEEVIYSILCAAGLPKYEAYFIAIRPQRFTHRQVYQQGAGDSKATRLISVKVYNIVSIIIPKNLQEMREPERTRGGKIKKPTKESLNRLLTEIISRGDDKQKLEGIKALNQLNQLNKEQSAEEERVHYYLPRLECENCPFLSGKDEKK
jgi:hypothetical protein